MANVREAAIVDKIQVHGLDSLADAVGILTGKLTPDPVECNLPDLFAKLSATTLTFSTYAVRSSPSGLSWSVPRARIMS